MTALKEARKTWPGKTDEWLYERLNQELKEKIDEIHNLLEHLPNDKIYEEQKREKQTLFNNSDGFDLLEMAIQEEHTEFKKRLENKGGD